MADLDPDECVFLCVGMMFAEVWAADPCPGGVSPLLIDQFTRKHENFLAADVTVPDKGLAGGPAHQRDMLCPIVVQREHLQVAGAWPERARMGVNYDMSRIAMLELVKLDQEYTTLLTEGRVSIAGGVAEVGAGTKVAAVVREYAFEYQYFLATRVVVR